jgi:uncharacterized protein with GYD domain
MRAANPPPAHLVASNRTGGAPTEEVSGEEAFGWQGSPLVPERTASCVLLLKPARQRSMLWLLPVGGGCLRQGERVMPTYVGLYTWTDQGIRNVKDTVKRVEEARAAFEKSGARVIAIYWTQGRYDLVSIAEFPDEETASAGALALGMAGNVHTETLRAFSAEEIQRVLDKLP